MVIVECLAGASRPSEERHYQSEQRRLSIEGDGIGWSGRHGPGFSRTLLPRAYKACSSTYPASFMYGYNVQPQAWSELPGR